MRELKRWRAQGVALRKRLLAEREAVVARMAANRKAIERIDKAIDRLNRRAGPGAADEEG